MGGLATTISRRLIANGLHSCRPLRRLPLTPPNRRQRLEWCRARSTWMTEWHRVVFSDESRFCLSSDSRRVRVWRRRGERSNPVAIVERPTVRQRGIMVWGAIAYDSRSPLLRIQGTMTAQRYVDDVLRPVTLPYLQGVPNALYQQDNARPHTARISQQALQDVQMLPWPPYSPDLSPIEHVWDIIGRRLHALPQPRSEDELWQMYLCTYPGLGLLSLPDPPLNLLKMEKSPEGLERAICQDGQDVVIQAMPEDPVLQVRGPLADGEVLPDQRPDVAARPIPVDRSLNPQVTQDCRTEPGWTCLSNLTATSALYPEKTAHQSPLLLVKFLFMLEVNWKSSKMEAELLLVADQQDDVVGVARVILETADIHFRENNNVNSEEKQSDNNTDTDTYFFIQEDEQLNNHVLSDVDIEEPAPDTMVNRQTESSESDRPQRTRTIPKRFDDYVLATTNETIPKDYEEAIACEDKKHWENAMLEEIQNMYSHQVWELVPRPVNAKVVKSKWVFKISKDQENENKTYKARLVAMGYNQIPGRDYNESFSPVIKNATLRTILSMAATKDSVIKLFDVKAAYLNGNIENTIFIEQPAGFVQDRNKVCKLNKSIYGLPQSGRSWYEKFSQVLHDCGLEKLKSDPCVFKWKNEDKYFYVGIYVDDFITVSDSEDTSNRFINKLRHHLEIKDVTCKGMFLGIKIIQDKEGISLQQSHYVQQILQKYGMENCKEVPTPGSKEINLDNHIEDDNCDQHTYQEALGMLMFLAVNTRPDIAYITSKLSQYSRQPKQMHWTAIKRVMRYLRGTIDLGVKFERGKTGILKSYADASWSTTHDGKSYGGYVLKLGEATIDWKSSKQPLVALSTMEAEMIAACESCCQIKWIINLLRELEEWNFMEKPTAIYTDSQSLINWISSPKQSSRCRHINRKYHFLRDCYESRDICLLYKPSQDLEADIFTKDLSRDQMKKHLESLSIVGIKPK
ncbi:hypothetical protein LAZ67_22001876 [Cordylochernes scorpioides]|uniref:Retrovirus-related Pol polyprotein from transposon TNT 1-94 n=1 Tax=Cordylochernes scorpioides TaxID=51811 RepID=A0ABY6LP89_9ARAC|nr:hypothetical protein LAZ67_22001876 [Cordylochernes scorpioides]